MARTSKKRDAALMELRAFGLAYPSTHMKSPWPGHMDLAVNDKTFVYLSVEGEPLRVGCKLPHTCNEALLLPFVTPMAHGLGRSGWVSASFAEGEEPPLALLKEWIDESYRAQAPKKLIASLSAKPDESERGDASKSQRSAPRAEKAAAKRSSSRRSSKQ